VIGDRFGIRPWEMSLVTPAELRAMQDYLADEQRQMKAG
jgi:hypothetical protein